MNHHTRFLSLAGFVVLATTAQAAPVEGTYTSVDLGGSMLVGRASQSWVTAHNASQGQGDVFNSQSWDGSALGTQWSFACSAQPGPQTVVDDRVSGTGFVIVTNTFAGGAFYLNPGPWGNGTGTIGPAAMTSVVSWSYIDFQIVSVRETVSLSAAFDNSDCALTLTSVSGEVRGTTDFAPLPANYPGFLDTACSATRLHGLWAEFPRMRMEISCPVSTAPAPWSRVKTIYR